MKQIGEVLGTDPQSATEPMPQSRGRSNDRWAMKKMEIASIVRQCFDLLETYGKTPEQLENLTLAMIEDLKLFTTDEVRKAFTIWRRDESKLPAVAHIRKIIYRMQKEKRSAIKLKTWAEFDPDWKGYKKYLFENGLLSPNLQVD